MSKPSYPSDKRMDQYLMPPYYPGKVRDTATGEVKELEDWRWAAAFPDGKKTVERGSIDCGNMERVKAAMYKVVDKRLEK